MNNDMIAVYHYSNRKEATPEGYYLNLFIDTEGLIPLKEAQTDKVIRWGEEGLGPFLELGHLKNFAFEYCLSKDREAVRFFSALEYNSIIDKCTHVQDLVRELKNASEEIGERLENTTKKERKGIFAKLFQ
jgi:hypothetical protein